VEVAVDCRDAVAQTPQAASRGVRSAFAVVEDAHDKHGVVGAELDAGVRRSRVLWTLASASLAA
jgi:hypothetical protein